jgi:DNA-binding response OmpR family regulator
MPIYLHPDGDSDQPMITGPRPLILFIDSHYDSAVMFATYCSAHGMRSIAATDAESALQVLRDVAPQVLVTALRIPRLGGAALIERVRAILGNTLPVLVVTGEVRAVEHEKALTAGANRIFVKPCSPDILLQEIRNLLPAGALPTRA